MGSSTITVKVTQAHIDAGVQRDCERCPVALALQEATGDKNTGLSDQLAIRWNDRYIPALPRVDKFIGEFDEGKNPSPFEFKIPAFDHVNWNPICAMCEAIWPDEELDGNDLCPDCQAEDDDEDW